MKADAHSEAQRREGVQVIARAAELLRQLATAPEGLTMVELAVRARLPRSTVYRIMNALAHEDFVREGPSGRLRIGPALVAVAVSSQRDLRHEVGPFMERLSRELNETVDLAVLDGGEVLFIDQSISPRTLRVVAEIGARFPVYCTANGKALLAALPPADAEKLLPRKLEPITPNTITDRDALRSELQRVREEGVAYDHEEHSIGVSAVATVVHDAAGVLGAISVIVPASRFRGSEEPLAAALARTREEIHAVLHGA